MKKLAFKKTIVTLLILVIIYWLPFGIVLLSSQSNIISSIEKLPNSDIIIVFGTVVNDSGEISPLLKERLEAGKIIMESGKSKKIVVSNTKDASNVMAEYLYSQGVPAELVEVDMQAEKTPDTCRYEIKKHPKKRKMVFISQGFHLPRLLYQCNKLDVKGIAFPAEALNTIDRSEYSFLTKFRVKTRRYVREAGLTWLAFLNIYK